MNVLKRGYAIVKRLDGSIVTRADAASKESALKLRFADNEVSVVPSGAAQAARPRPKSSGGDEPKQAKLF